MLVDWDPMLVLLLVNVSVEWGEPWREEIMKRGLIWEAVKYQARLGV
jgi:hypothetical protein